MKLKIYKGILADDKGYVIGTIHRVTKVEDLRALLKGAKRYSIIELNGKLGVYENPSGHFLKRKELLASLDNVSSVSASSTHANRKKGSGEGK